jgi:hypothetical protein
MVTYDACEASPTLVMSCEDGQHTCRGCHWGGWHWRGGKRATACRQVSDTHSKMVMSYEVAVSVHLQGGGASAGCARQLKALLAGCMRTLCGVPAAPDAVVSSLASQ